MAPPRGRERQGRFGAAAVTVSPPNTVVLFLLIQLTLALTSFSAFPLLRAAGEGGGRTAGASTPSSFHRHHRHNDFHHRHRHHHHNPRDKRPQSLRRAQPCFGSLYGSPFLQARSSLVPPCSALSPSSPSSASSSSSSSPNMVSSLTSSPSRSSSVYDRKRAEMQLRGLSKIGHWQSALNLFQRLRNFSNHKKDENLQTLSAPIYNVVIDAFRRGGPVEKANEVVLQMKEDGFTPTKDTYHALGKVIAANQDLEAAMKLYTAMKSVGLTPYPETYGSIIHACRGAGDEGKQMAIEMFASMGRDLVRPTTQVYNSLLATAADVEKVHSVLTQMTSMQVRPNTATYAIVLKLLASNNRAGDLERTMKNMQEQNVRPSREIYEALIDGYSRVGNFAEAIKVWEDAQNNVFPNNITMQAVASSRTKRQVLRAALKKDRWELCLSIYKILGEPPNIYTSRAVVVTLAGAGQCEEALKLFKVTTQGCTPQENIADADPQQLQGSTRVLNSLLAATVREKKWEVALEALEHARNVMKPDVVSYSSVISACARGGQYDLARRVLEEMRKDGVPRNTRTYNPLLYAAPDIATTKEVLREMKDDKECEPNEVTYVSIVTAAAKVRDVMAAEEAFQTLRKMSSLHPSLFAFNALASVYMRSGSWEKSLQLLKEMDERKVEPDVRTFTAMCGSCLKHRRWEVAISLLERMQGPRPQQQPVQQFLQQQQAEPQNPFQPPGQDARRDREHLVEASLKTYSTVLRVTNAAGAYVQSLNVYNDLRSRDIVPTAQIYSQVIEAACHLGDMNRALRLFKTTERANKLPSERTLQILVKHLIDYHQENDVVEVMRSPLLEGRAPATVSRRAYNAVLRSYAQEVGVSADKKEVDAQTEVLKNGAMDAIEQVFDGLNAQTSRRGTNNANQVQFDKTNLQKDIVITKIAVPSYIPRGDLLDQVVRWAMLERSHYSSTDPKTKLTVAPLRKDDGQLKGFKMFLGDAAIECVLDDLPMIQAKTVSTRRGSEGVDGTTTGKHLEVRRKSTTVITAKAKPILRKFLHSLSLAITNYIAFGSVFAEH